MAIACFLEMFERVSLAQLAVAALLLLFALLLRLSRPSYAHLPPCPRSLPFLGHIPLVIRFVSTSLRPCLGPIFSLRVGPSLLIFITSPSVAHEALVLHGATFASRPRIPSRAIFTNNFRSINGAPYGPHWRAMRKNLVHEMLASSKLLYFKPTRKRIVDALIDRLRGHAQNNKGVVAVYSNCHKSMLQLLLLMCIGIQMEDEAVRPVIGIVQEILPYQFGQVSDLFPSLQFLDWNKNRKQRAVRRRQIEVFAALIEQHKKLQKVNEVTPGSYLETLLHMDGEGETKLSTPDLVTLCTEFLVAGTDTSVNCIEWTICHLVKDPAIQAKLYEEIERVVGSRSVEEDDLRNMHYLQDVVKETLRLHPPTHISLPHAVTEPCKLAGYDIPTNAIINIHLTSISRDPEVWEDPLEYRPERFSAREVDITGIKQVTMIPFGAGRRGCPATSLALMHVELFVARLVQEYEWGTSKPGAVLDMSERRRFTIEMGNPLKAAIRERRASNVSQVDQLRGHNTAL